MLEFQCSSASRKFLNRGWLLLHDDLGGVSVLFSEPKIPQRPSAFPRLQRIRVSVLFSEPKIPQPPLATRETSSAGEFQCSSASRKFLNLTGRAHPHLKIAGFSALQRAENSSIADFSDAVRNAGVSVLFSEPKIPQLGGRRITATLAAMFQCSSASRKFLNRIVARTVYLAFAVSVLFSEPKIPQHGSNGSGEATISSFQCSSASRKFLNQRSTLTMMDAIRGFSALQRAENSSR